MEKWCCFLKAKGQSMENSALEIFIENEAHDGLIFMGKSR